MGFRGAIFDVDGVLVDSPHEQAWREGLRQLMENDWSDIRPQRSYAPEKFTPEVYQRVMSGKPRYSGAQAALEHFKVPDAERHALEYGDRYYPVIIDREAGGHYEIKNPLTGGILSYSNPEAAETYIKRAREKEQG
jgi:hypothetical protein